jgi:uncharacterized YccA/Bax inhibitor family protein
LLKVGEVVSLLAIPGFDVEFVAASVNIFKKQPLRGQILTKAGFRGLFVGGISCVFSVVWDGIVTRAVLGTLVVVGVTLFLFLTGRVPTSPNARKIFLVAMLGYMASPLVNFGLVMFGATESMFAIRSKEVFGITLDVLLDLLIVLLAAYSLVMSFESIKAGVLGGAPWLFG